MKADLSLTERQRMEAEDQRELRTALVRRHFDVTDGEQLVAGGALAHNLRVAAIVDAKLRARRTPLPPAPTVHVAALDRAAQPDLRARLGLS